MDLDATTNKTPIDINMVLDSGKMPRGRPKTINRDHILNVAMQAYWQKGIYDVSINEICKKAKISKPGLYREFGNEDGLMKAVLIKYNEKVSAPLRQALTANMTFRQILDNIVSTLASANSDKDAPRGCLKVKMSESPTHMGETTRQQIKLMQQQTLVAYENLVIRSKSRGEFSIDMSVQFAAIYIDAQISNALSRLARGEQSNTVGAILKVAFSMLK